MRDIYCWCIAHKIHVMTKFEYLKNMPITANIWNYYSYLRAKGEYKRLKRKYTEGVCFNTIIENEEKLWRIMMMKQYSRIENKLNHLLEVIDE